MITYDAIQGWWLDVANVVKQIAVRAQLTDYHDGSVSGIGRDADTEEANDVGMVEIAQKLKLIEVHCRRSA